MVRDEQAGRPDVRRQGQVVDGEHPPVRDRPGEDGGGVRAVPGTVPDVRPGPRVVGRGAGAAAAGVVVPLS
ncbi:hypothetical protein ACUY2Q_03245, partial [Corynebacterium bovis]